MSIYNLMLRVSVINQRKSRAMHMCLFIYPNIFEYTLELKSDAYTLCKVQCSFWGRGDVAPTRCQPWQ